MDPRSSALFSLNGVRATSGCVDKPIDLKYKVASVSALWEQTIATPSHSDGASGATSDVLGIRLDHAAGLGVRWDPHSAMWLRTVAWPSAGHACASEALIYSMTSIER